MTDAAPAAKPANPRHKWYIVHAYSNFEKKVAQHLQDQARQQGLEDCFSEILQLGRFEVEIIDMDDRRIDKLLFRQVVKREDEASAVAAHNED